MKAAALAVAFAFLFGLPAPTMAEGWLDALDRMSDPKAIEKAKQEDRAARRLEAIKKCSHGPPIDPCIRMVDKALAENPDAFTWDMLR